MPFGWITSPLVLLYLNKKMKGDGDSHPNRFARWALIGIAGAPLSFLAVLPIANLSIDNDVKACNGGSKEACKSLVSIPTAHSRVSNPYLKELVQKAAEEERQKKIALAKAEAEEKAANDKRVAAEKRAAARKKFLAWAQSSNPFIGCKLAVKDQLRDPGSYDDDWAQPRPVIDKSKDVVSYMWSFRSKNGFGGYTQAAATCDTRPDTSNPSNDYGVPDVGIVQM